MKQNRFFASLRMTVALIVLLASGLSAFAASTFTVSNPTGSTFRITRTGNTSVAETIDWRVVSLSAIAGIHFTGYNGNYSGTVTFNVNDTYKDVPISEPTLDDNYYKYQTGSDRSYRFEVLDRNGDILSSCDRTITSGLSQFSAAKVSNSVTNLVTMSNGNFSSGMSSSKYLDVSYTPPSGDVQGSKQDLPGYVLIDDSYDYAQKPATVSTSSLINSTGASASYLNSQSYKIYATVCFTEKERDDGYQYLQIIAGNSAASYDTGADPNGQVNNPSNSIYKVCFEFADNSNAEGKIYFPHRGTTSSEFSNSNGVLHQQKYKSGYDGNGAVILPVTTSYITTRFDAGGDNDDTWGYKDFFVRMALRDNTAPTVLNNYKVSGGRHQKGNTIYVSVPFKEIVTVTGTPTLASNWGTLSYIAGSGSNVLTFMGIIDPTDNNAFSVSSFSLNGGTIKDLAGNSFSGSISHDFGTTLDSDYVWSTSNFNSLNDGSYEIYTTLDLRHLALMVNSGNNNCSGLTFKQTHDITYSHTTNWNNSSSQENNYTAIGTDGHSFQGTFDGQDHTISGIRIYRGGSNLADRYQGLFGDISGGIVRAVNLADARITGFASVGGIAGQIFDATVEDCTVAANVCIHAVLGSSYYHGGIVGNSQGTVQRCLSRARLTVTDASNCMYYGAIVGQNSYNAVKDCIAIGATVPDISSYRGAIIGYGNILGGTYVVQRNYYRACTVAGVENATGVGVGYDKNTTSPHDVTANQGALPLYSLTLPNGVTLVRSASATLPGTGNATYTTGADIDGTPYAFDGATLNLSYTGAAAALGYKIAVYVNGVLATDNGNGTYTATMPAADATVTTAQVPIPWSGSGNSANDPYLIEYPSQLDLLATNVNAGNNYSGKYFALKNDITYSHTTNWNNSSSTENNYTAIGTSANRFCGTFDGRDFTISGIRIYKSGNTDADCYLGLFGAIGSNGVVKGVTLADIRITGGNYVGGIVGFSNSATVEDCNVAADVCIHTVQYGNYHGGIVGHHDGTVQRCFSSATLTIANVSSKMYYGSIAGECTSNTKVIDCLAIGATVPNIFFAGAITGQNNGKFTRNYYRACTVAGTANATGVGVGPDDINGSRQDVTKNQGALALYSLTLPSGVALDRTASATLPGTGNATYTTGADIDGAPYAFEGAELSLSYTGDAAAEGYSIALYVNGVQATDNGNGTYIATMPAADANVTVGQTPILSYFWGPNDGDSEDHPYTITTTAGLDLLATLVNAGNDFSGKFFELANDITYTHTSNWNDANSTENNYTAIGGYTKTFNGTFDGKGYTVSGIRIYKNGTGNTAGFQGLFGNAGSNSTVKNLTISDVRITGRNSVGGVAGYSSGLIENCHVTATVCIHAVQSNSDYHGGIVGQSAAQNRGCTSSVKLTIKDGITGCYSYGGIVGYKHDGFIRECLSIGVSLPSVTQVGAIAGLSYLNSSIVKNFFHDCTIGSSAATVGYTYNDNDYSTAEWAEPGYTVACAAGITASASGSIYASYDYDGLTVYQYGDKYGITYGGIAYYTAGPTVTLSGTGSAPAGYQEPFLGYSLNGADLPGNTFEMTAADATVTARWTVKDFTSGHAGIEADPYIIYNKDQLDLLASRVNGGTNYSGKFIKLGADIAYDPDDLDVNGENYTPIGGYYESTIRSFSGSFDGDGHTVSGIRINKTGSGAPDNRKGLFGAITNAVIKNLTVSDTRITANSNLGGIVGKNSGGTVENCHATNSVSIISSDGIRFGGIVGDNSDSGTIRGCTSAAIVSGGSTSAISGGIAGFNPSSSIIEHCLAIGTSVTVGGGSGQKRGGAIVGCNSYDSGNYCAILNHNYYYGSTVTIGNKSYTNNIGAGNLANGTFNCTDVNSATILGNDYTDCAVLAITSTTKPAEIGAQIATYSNGLTVYEHGAYYNGTYYLRHDLAGTAEALTLVQGTKDGVSAYWGTYFDSTTNYELSEGAAAYTLGTDFKLYRLGTNGRTIPKNTAVVIIATSASVTLVPAGTGDLSITDHATGGNILVGNDADTSYPTIYVLSVNAGEIGFRKLSTGTLPAHKAGYKPQAGMQDYDKQGNQEW